MCVDVRHRVCMLLDRTWVKSLAKRRHASSSLYLDEVLCRVSWFHLITMGGGFLVFCFEMYAHVCCLQVCLFTVLLGSRREGHEISYDGSQCRGISSVL